jgi:beta-lactamase regulating signal transducer with metallopeptidase domain
MSELLILRALLLAGECFLASLFLPLLGFAATALLRRRAALRHLVWTTMFGVLAVLPIVALLLPPRQIVEHVAAPVMDAIPVAAVPVIAAPPPSLSDLFTLEHGVLLLVGLWLVGLCWQALRLGLGRLGLMRLRRRSSPFAAEIETGCDVRLSQGEDGPCTFGILRPLILLPRSAQGWPVARLEAVLRHEAAHVARRDAASQLLARLVCAVLWLNPLLWLAARALRRDAEIAADDAVLASGMTPSLYAAELVRLAAEANGIAPGIAMATPPLTQRVEAVLADNSSRKGVTRMDIAKTVSFGLAVTLLLGVARFDIAVAQNAPAPKMERNGEKDAAIEARTKAETAAVKAKVDAVVAQAKAKAAAETDPAKREQYRKAAEQIAADAARVRTDADRAAVQYAVEARKHMAMAFQLADEVRQQAEQRQRLAEAMPPSGGHAESSASRSESVTINGTTYSGNVELKQDRRGGPITITADRASADRVQADDAQRQSMKAMADAHIDQQIAKAMADAHLSETIAKALADAHLDETTRKAIMDAHIEQRIVEAMARVQPKIDAAARAAAKIPAIPPVPPAPLPPPPAPLPPIAPN